MRVKLFTLRYSSTLGGFDDELLQVFMGDKEITGFREHFFVLEDAPHLCCVVTYHDAVVGKHPAGAPATKPATGSATSRAMGSSSRNGRPDPTEGLDAQERALFQKMREWRTETAYSEGVPPYVVLTNRELVEVVRKKPDSLTALTAIQGIGRQKIKRYGKKLLAGLHGTVPASSPGKDAEPEQVEVRTAAQTNAETSSTRGEATVP